MGNKGSRWSGLIWTGKTRVIFGNTADLFLDCILHIYEIFSFHCHHIPPGDKAEACVRAKVTNRDVQARPHLVPTQPLACFMSKCKQLLAFEAKWCRRFSAMWNWSLRWGLSSCKLPAVEGCRRAMFLGLHFCFFCWHFKCYHLKCDNVISKEILPQWDDGVSANALTMHFLHHQVFQTYFRLVWFCFFGVLFLSETVL